METDKSRFYTAIMPMRAKVRDYKSFMAWNVRKNHSSFHGLPELSREIGLIAMND